MRTTIDIDDPVLKELKQLQQREGKTLGRLVTDLLAESLARRPGAQTPVATLNWISRPMDARIDIADREALLDAMDQD